MAAHHYFLEISPKMNLIQVSAKCLNITAQCFTNLRPRVNVISQGTQFENHPFFQHKSCNN